MTWRDSSWDRVKINGRVMPGRVRSLVITPERDVQASKQEGEDGIATKDQGYNGASVELVLEIFKARDVPAAEQEIARIHPRQTGGVATPHTIEHPIASIFNVRNIYIKSISAGMPEGGRWPITISAGEWFPPEEKKPTKTKGGGSTPAKSDAEASLDPAAPTDAAGAPTLPAFKPGDSGGDFGSSEVPAPDPANKGASFT